MTASKLGLIGVLGAFLALTEYAVYQHGYLGLLALATANAGTVQVSTDLVIALALVSAWIIRDARERGVSPLPYLLVTLTLGSIGPLLYLIVRRPAGAPERHLAPRTA